MDGLKIIALGSALPGRLVSNDELSHYADTSDEWIFPRTGIHDRYFCEKEESAMTLAVRAAREALGRSGIDPSELGAVVVATMSADFATPSLPALWRGSWDVRRRSRPWTSMPPAAALSMDSRSQGDCFSETGAVMRF